MNRHKINYDNRTIVQQAQNYTDVYRILAEYVDNSIDSAEECYDSVSESYNRKINISISKEGTSKSNRSIEITDNANGIMISPNQELTIFDSSKRSDPNTNGMYGMGMFSFLAICKKMSVETRQSNSNVLYTFEITTGTFDTPNGSAPEYELKNNTVKGSNTSGYTKITLTDFQPEKFEEIDLKILKKEIEQHFELILNRKNIEITFQNFKENPLQAERYDYKKVSATSYTKIIDKLYKTNSKKYNTKKEIDIKKNPCKIFLAVSKNVELNRQPVFVCKGRRVTEVSKIDQLRTNNKSSIWSNPNVTGYIDVTGILEPIPTRIAFKNTPNANAFYQALIKLEPEIKQFIENESIINLSNKQSKFEVKINEAVNEFLQNSGIFNDSDTNYKEYTINSFYRKLSNDYKNNTIAPVIPQKKGSSKRVSQKKTSNTRERDKKITIRIPEGGNHIPNLKIIIDDINDPQTDNLNNQLRSVYRGGKIHIYTKHPEFKSRISKPRDGIIKHNDKIIHYVAVEIITHLYSLQKNKTENYVYVKFANSIYELEKSLYSINVNNI